MTESTPPVAPTVHVPFRTATIVTLVVAVLSFASFILVGRAEFQDYTGFLYFLLVLVSIACLVVSIVLRVRTKRAGAPTLLATITVIVSSVAIGLLIIGAVLLVGAFVLLVAGFFAG